MLTQIQGVNGSTTVFQGREYSVTGPPSTPNRTPIKHLPFSPSQVNEIDRLTNICLYSFDYSIKKYLEKGRKYGEACKDFSNKCQVCQVFWKLLGQIN